MPSTDRRRTPAEPVLEARDVTKRYGAGPGAVTALDGVDLTVESGECVVLVGESGSGKTTLLRAFNRMVVPDGGEVRVLGRPVSRIDPVRLRRDVGYVPQDGGLLPHWTVLRNASMVPWLRGSTDARTRGREALVRVGLSPEEVGGRWPRQLSGGQRQRVAIARALAHDPDVILLDEPFGALDALTRADLQESFRRLVTDLGITALLVTHDLQEAFLLADRIAVMRRGLVEQVGTPGTLRDQPATAYVEKLLDRARMGRGAPGRAGTP